MCFSNPPTVVLLILQLLALRRRNLPFKNCIAMLWRSHILKVMYLPFKFKQYSRTESGQWFWKNKMATPSWNLRLFKNAFFLAKQEEIGKKHMDSGWACDIFSTWISTLLIFVVWLKINFGEAFRFEREKNPCLGLNQHLWHLINHCLMKPVFPPKGKLLQWEKFIILMPSADHAFPKRSSLIIIEAQEQTYFMSLANFSVTFLKGKKSLYFPIFYLHLKRF